MALVSRRSTRSESTSITKEEHTGRRFIDEVVLPMACYPEGDQDINDGKGYISIPNVSKLYILPWWQVQDSKGRQTVVVRCSLCYYMSHGSLLHI
ncbi:CPS_collapsed_G0003340.mRNA.1.CDS.1 [Saccharomyces cerevisiae]|nr:CPS_collapsed_G0003340.mRNA.1.CDS.1 [Saccharomyces cerevisiae]